MTAAPAEDPPPGGWRAPLATASVLVIGSVLYWGGVNLYGRVQSTTGGTSVGYLRHGITGLYLVLVLALGLLLIQQAAEAAGGRLEETESPAGGETAAPHPVPSQAKP